jgi:muramoyltetrapeptide carboxypeptidase
MKQPPFLKKGDKIGVVAPARKILLEEIQPAIDILESWGLEVVSGKNLFHQDNQFSGTDAERVADLQNMLDDTSIKAVISARGGYGALRIIDSLDFKKFKKHPKWVVGYSDITVLHSHINKLGVQTLHATMPINFTKNKEATETLYKALFGRKINYKVKLHSLNKKAKGVKTSSVVEGELVGGNLSLLYALAGSKSDIDTKGKILFIEDLDEYLYHVDRMMLQLKRSGKLKSLKALVVGGMTDMKDNTIPFGKTAEEIILDAVKEYNYPVVFGFPAGHIDENFALYFGKKAKLKIGKTVELTY